jgi:hypothetical protein
MVWNLPRERLELVTLNFASWNQVGEWLRGLEALRQVNAETPAPHLWLSVPETASLLSSDVTRNRLFRP